MVLNLQAYENMKQDSIDLLGQYRKDFPPQYLEWVEKAKRLSGLDFYRNQAIRTEIRKKRRAFRASGLIVFSMISPPDERMTVQSEGHENSYALWTRRDSARTRKLGTFS
jgi:hypothetical protein